jgi:hypothetical protein
MQRLLKNSALAIFAFSAAASQAYAETPDHYCKYYATHAIHLGQMARSVSSCRHLVAEAPQRWSLNYNQQFSYCMRIYGTGRGAAEDATRTREVKFCAGP